MSTRVEETAPEDLLRQASALGIPWEKILSEEIRAERTLQLWLSDLSEDWPLWPAFRILPVSFLSSWRVRDRIQVLAWKASRSGCESAARQLRALHVHLLGRENGRGTDATLMAQHLWFGHQRVLALLRISRASEKACGSVPERMDLVRETTGCSDADARWGIEPPTRLAAAIAWTTPCGGRETRASKCLRTPTR